MITFGIYKGKELRVCLECGKGILIADVENTKKQKVYCVNCGTMHTYKRTKKHTTVEKFDEVCNQEKINDIVKENIEVLKEAIKQIAMMDEVIKAELAEIKKRRGENPSPN